MKNTSKKILIMANINSSSSSSTSSGDESGELKKRLREALAPGFADLHNILSETKTLTRTTIPSCSAMDVCQNGSDGSISNCVSSPVPMRNRWVSVHDPATDKVRITRRFQHHAAKRLAPVIDR
jgi:hypothetical protein